MAGRKVTATLTDNECRILNGLFAARERALRGSHDISKPGQVSALVADLVILKSLREKLLSQ